MLSLLSLDCYRTVQITQDMESFWAVQYPKIKPALSRRYPKHEWR